MKKFWKKAENKNSDICFKSNAETHKNHKCSGSDDCDRTGTNVGKIYELIMLYGARENWKEKSEFFGADNSRKKTRAIWGRVLKIHKKKVSSGNRNWFIRKLKVNERILSEWMNKKINTQEQNREVYKRRLSRYLLHAA